MQGDPQFFDTRRERNSPRNALTDGGTRLQPDSEDGGLIDTVKSTVRGLIPGDDSTSQPSEKELQAEAVQRLQERDEKITQEAIDDEVSRIREEWNIELSDSRAGLIADKIERIETVRMAVGPERVKRTDGSYLKRTGEHGGTKYVREMIVVDYPREVRYGWLDWVFTKGLSTNGAELRASYHIKPIDRQDAIKKLNKQVASLSVDLKKKEEKGKVDTDEKEQKKSHAKQLKKKLISGGTKLFQFGFYLEIVADSENKLRDATAEVKQNFAQEGARVVPLYDQQTKMQTVMAPLARDNVKQTHPMSLDNIATCFPFADPSVIHPSGVLMGMEMGSNSPVIVDRWELSGHNAIVSGKIGGGKTYFVKLLMWRRLMMEPESEIIIIDPAGDFRDFAKSVGEQGDSVTMGGGTILNPLEIKPPKGVSLDEIEGHPYDNKIASVKGFLKTYFESRDGLTGDQEGLLDRVLTFAYLDAGITRDIETHHKQSPIIDDVLRMLHELKHGNHPSEFLDVPSDYETYVNSVDAQEVSDIAADLLIQLEPFRRGGQFEHLNGHSNVDLSRRVVHFDLETLGENTDNSLYMFLVLDWLLQRVKSTNRNTLIAIDEAHFLLRKKEPLDLLNTFIRRSRHFNSGVTLMSQTVEEYMDEGEESEGKAKEIYNQCDIRAMFKHKDLSEEAQNALGLSRTERDFILQAQAGENSGYSECLLDVTDVGNMRLRVESSDFEHHVIDSDMSIVDYMVDHDFLTENKSDIDSWAYFLREGFITWRGLPDQVQKYLKQSPDYDVDGLTAR